MTRVEMNTAINQGVVVIRSMHMPTGMDMSIFDNTQDISTIINQVNSKSIDRKHRVTTLNLFEEMLAHPFLSGSLNAQRVISTQSPLEALRGLCHQRLIVDLFCFIKNSVFYKHVSNRKRKKNKNKKTKKTDLHQNILYRLHLKSHHNTRTRQLMSQ